MRPEYVTIYLCLCTLAGFPLAASKHYGRVTFDGLPRAGAVVTAIRADKESVTATDQQGAYSYADLADGPWTIEVKMTGFLLLKDKVIVAPGALPTRWELKLLPLERVTTASAPAVSTEDEVDVYMESDNTMSNVLWPAQIVVSDIFSKVGVKITWHAGSVPKDYRGGISWTIFSIRWAVLAPGTADEGALAAAHPLGSREASIILYEDRIRLFLNRYRDAQNIVFAYVVAHELAHVMQRLNRHSDAGILKTQWSSNDFFQMRTRSLGFTADDVELIHNGLTHGFPCATEPSSRRP
jgi:hypothetical protein